MCLKNMNALVRQIMLTLMVSLGIVYCEPPLNNQYGVPGNLPVNSNNQGPHGGSITNSYGAPLHGSDGHHDEHQDYIDSQPKSYEFGYAVKDSATGNDFGRQETSDGETVRGEYRVQLPDGRTQIVTYTADWRTGFHADVRYEGEAIFPDQYNTGFNNNAYNNNNGYSQSGYNNNYNNGAGYNSNQGNSYTGGNFNDYQNQQGYNNNYQFGTSNNQYSNNGYNGNNNFGSNGPRPTYGTPQFH